MTAKTPGFTPEQIEITYRSLEDLRDHLKGRNDIMVIWRVTQKLHKRLGVENTIKDVLSTELYDILANVDAVITTPSTTILESMLFGHPVAILDYHNCPHYVPAAWRITCREHIERTVEGLRLAPLDRMLYQEFCLHDALSCRTPAFPRMVELIEGMIRIRKEHMATGKKDLVFPHRIVGIPEEHISWPSVHFDLQILYPHHPVFGRRDIVEMQAELESALGTVDLLKNQVRVLSNRLYLIPGYKLVVRLHRYLKDKF
jgi:hypothetical protein